MSLVWLHHSHSTHTHSTVHKQCHLSLWFTFPMQSQTRNSLWLLLSCACTKATFWNVNSLEPNTAIPHALPISHRGWVEQHAHPASNDVTIMLAAFKNHMLTCCPPMHLCVSLPSLPRHCLAGHQPRKHWGGGGRVAAASPPPPSRRHTHMKATSSSAPKSWSCHSLIKSHLQTDHQHTA